MIINVFRVRLGLRFQKVRFKITILKCAIWKKWFLKTQLSVWQNRSLAFKIESLPLKFCVFKKSPSYLRFEKADFLCFQIQFLKKQFPNDLCSAIRFKIVLIVYEIAIPNAPLVGREGTIYTRGDFFSILMEIFMWYKPETVRAIFF